MSISELKQELAALGQQEKLGLIRWLLDSMMTRSDKNNQQSTQDNDHEFFESAGLWANREIDQSSLRRNAWPQRSS